MQQKKVMLIVLLVLIVTVGYLTSLSTLNSDAHFCRLEDGVCQISSATVDAQVSIVPHTIPLESALTVSLLLSAEATVESAWVEGINMYMGKIPLALVESEPSHWQGRLFLKMCSEPEMQWQLIVKLRVANGQRQSRRFIFSTSY